MYQRLKPLLISSDGALEAYLDLHTSTDFDVAFLARKN